MFSIRRSFQFSVVQMVMALAVCAVVVTLCGALTALYQFNSALYSARWHELRNEVESAASLVRGLAAREGTGSANKAIELLRPSRFGEHGYYFVEDFDGIARLMPTAPKLEGSALSEVHDANGRYFFKEMLSMAKAGQSGQVNYVWPKPGGAAPVEKISYVAPVPELGFFIGSGAYTDDIREGVLAIFSRFALVVVPLMLALFALAFVVSRTIRLRLRGATAAMERLASGDFDVALPGIDRRDEIGDIVRAVEKFKLKLIDSAHAEEAQRESHRRAAAETRRNEMMELAQHFENAVGCVVASVASSSQEMEAIARSLVQDARRAGEQAEIGASSASTTSHNIQSLAAAAEELSHSAVEIGEHTSRARTISLDAAAVAEKTRSRMAELDECISHIDGIVLLISGIAEQTNMLALNATIEAARAGEAGRGFAVVASEVKTLADQTQKATAEISAKIGNIQKASHEASECIGEMSSATHEVSVIAASVGASIDMQGQATREIAQNVHETSDLAGGLAHVVEEVRVASDHTGLAAEETLQAVSQLAEQTEALRGECNRFLAQVRSA